jgi:catechol 2,3-dioxygenase-like lactoylglutathione lyase family enzyme
MFSHVMLGCNDVAAAKAFYKAVLAPLGLNCVAEDEEHGAFAASKEDMPWFWVGRPYDQAAASAGNGTHLAFLAPSRRAVDRFYETALAQGGRDEGAPGLRPQYSETYYGAYVRDLDGHKIQAVCYAAA